jgi:hypothetical protein
MKIMWLWLALLIAGCTQVITSDDVDFTYPSGVNVELIDW